MHNRFKLLRSKDGICLVEIIITMAILGAVIAPLMNLLVMSAKINHKSNREYKSILEAQGYVEEIKAMDAIDTSWYVYDSSKGSYIRTILQNDNSFGAEIKIEPESNLLYFIEVKIFDDGEEINSLMATKIIQ